MQGSQPLNNVIGLGHRQARGVSNMAVYASIAVFLAMFWLIVALMIL